jgi:hypothetical protein
MTNNPLNPAEIYFAGPNAFWGSIDGGTNWYTSTAGLDDVIYDPGGPITQTYGLLSLGYRPGDAWLMGTVRGLYSNVYPATETWLKVIGPAWQNDRVLGLLWRWLEPQTVFVTTPDGVYVYSQS